MKPGMIVVFCLLWGCVEPDRARPYEDFVEDYNRIKGISSNNTNGSTNNPSANNQTNNTNNQSNLSNQNNPVILPVPCSDNGGGPIDVEFVNRSSVTAELFWVNSNCEEFKAWEHRKRDTTHSRNCTGPARILIQRLVDDESNKADP